METIPLDKNKQKRFNKNVKKMKDKIVKGEIKIKDVQKNKKKKKGINREGRGVIYLGHIPHGFYENEMRGYFGQFGVVTRLRLARSKRTGRSKGYAFIEFLHEDVAQIVAETMDNYLMFNHILKCKVVPKEDRHEKMFVRSITEKNFPKKRYQKISTDLKNKTASSTREEKRRQKKLKKIEDFKKFFEERGIEFNFKVNDSGCNINQNGTITNGAGGDSDTDSESSLDSLDNYQQSDTEEQYGVLEIDESDDDIQFTTPPQVKKIIKRSSSAHLGPTKVKKIKGEMNGNMSKFPKIKGNSKWTEKQEVPKKHGKGVGKKFEQPKQTKEKPKLATSFKPKVLKKVKKTVLEKEGRKMNKTNKTPSLTVQKKVQKNKKESEKKTDVRSKTKMAKKFGMKNVTIPKKTKKLTLHS